MTVGYGFSTASLNSESLRKPTKKRPSLGKSIRELKFESPYIRITNKDSHGNAVRRILFDKNSSLQSTLYQDWIGDREGMDRVLELMYTPTVASLSNPYSYGAKTAKFSYIPEPNPNLIKDAPTFTPYSVFEELPDLQKVIAERRKNLETPLMKVKSPQNELNKTTYAFWIRDTSGPEGVISEGLDLDRAYEKGFRKTNSSYYNGLIPRNPTKGFPSFSSFSAPQKPFPSLATDFTRKTPMVSGDIPSPFSREEIEFRQGKWSAGYIDKEKLQPPFKDETPFFPAPAPVRDRLEDWKFDIFKALDRTPSKALPFSPAKWQDSQRMMEKKDDNDSSRITTPSLTEKRAKYDDPSALKTEADDRAKEFSGGPPTLPPSKLALSFDPIKNYPRYLGYGNHFRFNDSIGRFTNLSKTTGRLSADSRISADRPLPDSERPISFFMNPRTSPYNQDYFQSLIRRPFGTLNQDRYNRHKPSFHRHDRDDFFFNR